jgi:hypothetical protein
LFDNRPHLGRLTDDAARRRRAERGKTLDQVRDAAAAVAPASCSLGISMLRSSVNCGPGSSFLWRRNKGHVTPNVVARVAVERDPILGWTRYTGLRGHVIGMQIFGASAPRKELQ